jgi:hypothetical protein
MQRADVRFVTAQKASYAADLGVGPSRCAADFKK